MNRADFGISDLILMKERIFIQKAKEHVKLEEFIRNQYSNAKCGRIDVQHTPIVTRIIIHTTTPGLIIGTGGERTRETVEILKKDLKIENPQIDVQRIDEPDLDPYIIAQTIASSVEGGVNHKRLGNYFVQRIMQAGAVGCEIIFAGKFSGQRGKTERFAAGYLKKCGEPARSDVMKGFAKATPKLGVTGITVKIMMKQQESVQRVKEHVEQHDKKERDEKAALEKHTIDKKEEKQIEALEAKEEFMEEKG